MSVEELREIVKGYSTQSLLDQYVHQRSEFTPEAVAVLEQEISRRNISQADIEEFTKKSLVGDVGVSGNVEVKHFKRDDFVKLDGSFGRNDANLLRAMFAEEDVPFYQDASVAISPVGNQDLRQQRVHVFVHKDSKEKAMALINAHFDADAANEVYSIKYTDTKERLKSFSFQDIQHAEIDATDIVDAAFSREEKDVLARYARRLVDEIDRIESSQDRIVFFFDHVEELAGRLAENNAPLSKTDLLTALEVLQIYCDEPDFPQAGLGIAEALLKFFMQ